MDKLVKEELKKAPPMPDMNKIFYSKKTDVKIKIFGLTKTKAKKKSDKNIVGHAPASVNNNSYSYSYAYARSKKNLSENERTKELIHQRKYNEEAKSLMNELSKVSGGNDNSH
ncbi:MAG: hypothetical protein HQK51_11980 [Oligoflexia bacterium]|nr:hypothetical protein [Oligoflexia bacterium]